MRKLQAAVPAPKDERWSGPEKYGISFSHLNRFLECPERFYLFTFQGVDEDEGFKLPMMYGSVFHAGDESARNGEPFADGIEAEGRKILARYPTATKGVGECVAMAKMQYPEYRRYWQGVKTPKRTEVFAERGFKVPYRLLSGRIVYLRGIIDGGFTEQVLSRGSSRFYVQENKTKGKIDEQAIPLCLPSELQSLFYVIAAGKLRGIPPVHGLLYNVIRRPFSERWAIRQKKSETRQQFYKRYVTDLLRKKPKEYFYRWKATLTAKQVKDFRRQTLDPILERLCTWYDHVEKCVDCGSPEDRFSEPHGLHYQAPFGTYNSLAGGWRGSYFNYLTSGRQRTSGLVPKIWSDGKYAPGPRPITPDDPRISGKRRADGTPAPRPRKAKA